MSGSSPPAPLSVFFRNFSNLAWRPFKSRKRFSRRTAWRREEDTEGQHLSQRWSWRAENRACCSESWPSLSQYPDTPQEDTEHKTGTTCRRVGPLPQLHWCDKNPIFHWIVQVSCRRLPRRRGQQVDIWCFMGQTVERAWVWVGGEVLERELA